MAGLKSLDDLKALRDKYKDTLGIRDAGEKGDKIRIAVGMATCGIASGSRETINAIFEEVNRLEIKNVNVVQAGCMGYCYAEPTVEVRIPGEEPVIYGKVDAQRGKEIVERHIKNGQVVNEWLVKRTFESV